MYYALMGEDVPNSLDKRMAARPGHLARLQALQDEGRLLIAGPLPAVDAVDPGAAGYTGSLIVAEFESLEAAQEWAEEDPYTVEGVFARMTVKPFRKVFPA
ncbi:MAG: YciI family protein [Methyloversatilis discipulorum]|uniref:YciI family protein n=1 Tax=Methyloversatilis discipulorum TaxID=1119528 RepID=UPI0026F2B9CC|nr:YciI family protein [Methyloversatilis discipulorum]MBT9515915.1 YciI family protein [Methyloversatilis discipulorum]